MHSSFLLTLKFRPASGHFNQFVSLPQRPNGPPSQPQSSNQGSKFSSTGWTLSTPAAVLSCKTDGGRTTSLDGRMSPAFRARVGSASVKEGIVHGINSSDEDDVLANVVKILKPEDKFRYHKVPKLKALKLRVRPALVLHVLKHTEVKPSYKWKFFVWAEKQMNYKHTGETYNAIITILLEIRKFTSIYFLLEDMYKGGLSLTAQTCMRMAKTFGSAGMVERAINALKHMTSLGSPATTRHLNSVVTELVKSQHHYKAYVAYKEMAKADCEPDGQTFKLLLRDLGRVKKVELGCHIFDEMQERGCEPDAETASAVIGILCQGGRMEDALLVFENLKQKGFKPNVKVYNSILSGLGKASNVEKAMEIAEEIHVRGFYPEEDSLVTLIDLLVTSGREEDALRCRGRMK